MKISTKNFLSFLALMSLSLSARAGLLDLRVGAGIQSTNPSSFEDRVKETTGKGWSSKDLDTYNADLVLRLPVLPLTIGARYELAARDVNENGTDVKMNVNNIDALVSWRIINSKFYLGPIVSIGYPWATIKFKNANSSEDLDIKSKNFSYGGGLETGIYLGSFLIGAEAGYKSIQLKSSSASNSINSDVNLQGFYGKAMLGVTFL